MLQIYARLGVHRYKRTLYRDTPLEHIQARHDLSHSYVGAQRIIYRIYVRSYLRRIGT